MGVFNKYLLVTSIVCFCVGVFWFMPKHTQQKLNNVLVVGTSSGFPPYELLGSNGTIVGFDIDVAQAIATSLGKKLEIKDMAFDALVLALAQGKIDIMIAGLSITPERLKKCSFVQYGGSQMHSIALLFWKQIPEGVSSIDGLLKLKNKTVCVQTGTIQDDIVGSYPFLTIRHLENNTDLFLDIKYGKSIAAVLDIDVALTFKKEYPELQIIEVPLKDDQKSFGYGIGIAKQNTGLLAHVQASVDQLKKTGVLKKLHDKWFTKGGVS